jgi:Domain of unknown function (DUF4406)
MTARILYLAGQMTGLPEHNYPAFNAAAARLRAAGYEVVNPAELGLPDGLEWIEYMRAGIAAMMTRRCDGVALMPGWQGSKGALAEWSIAGDLGFHVGACDFWLADKGVTP